MASPAVTLSDVYQHSRHCLVRVRDGLERLERLENTGGTAVADLAQEVQQDLAQVQNGTLEIERLCHQQIPASHRGLWKRKVEQTAEESRSLKLSLEEYLARQHRWQAEAHERVALLKRLNGDSAKILQAYDEEAQVMESTQNSSRMLDDACAAGTALLAKFSDQRDRLKAAQRKVLDVMNTVGMSNSVLKVIERRLRIDKWISYGGICVTIIIVVAFWMWVKG